MNKVYLEKYKACCALGNDIDTIFENMVKNQSGILTQAYYFPEEEIIPVGRFRHDLPELNLDHNHLAENLCFRLIQESKNEHFDFSSPQTLIIIATTKGEVQLLKKLNEEASIAKLAENLQNSLKAKNPILIISNACVSGIMALVHAHDLIKTNKYETIVVCAIDLLSDFVLSGFHTFQALSNVLCKPYDQNRSGINLGEACAVAVLSTRKSDIEILGGASSNDANHISGPSRDGSGLALAIKKTLDACKIDQVDLINAHGTATLYNDEMEGKAFASLLLNTTPLNSLKAYFGHTLAASGLIESLLCAEMIKNKLAIKCLGTEKISPSCGLNVLLENKSLNLHTILKTGSGFGGCNAAIVLQKTT